MSDREPRETNGALNGNSYSNRETEKRDSLKQCEYFSYGQEHLPEVQRVALSQKKQKAMRRIRSAPLKAQ